jgi:lysophospholipase L1-like esterase
VVRRIREKLPQTRLVIMAILPRGADPKDPAVAAMRTKIDFANRALAALADGKRTHSLDLGPLLLAPDGSLPASLLPDALHLSDAAYRIWADALEPLLDDGE